MICNVVWCDHYTGEDCGITWCPAHFISNISNTKDVNTIISNDTDSDYVKVVHCKDCKYYKSYCDKYKSFCAYHITEYDKHNGECSYIGKRTGVFNEVSETDFCSCAERSESNE